VESRCGFQDVRACAQHLGACMPSLRVRSAGERSASSSSLSWRSTYRDAGRGWSPVTVCLIAWPTDERAPSVVFVKRVGGRRTARRPPGDQRVGVTAIKDAREQVDGWMDGWMDGPRKEDRWPKGDGYLRTSYYQERSRTGQTGCLE
jgi:hypothetical protein